MWLWAISLVFNQSIKENIGGPLRVLQRSRNSPLCGFNHFNQQVISNTGAYIQIKQNILSF